MSLIKRKFKGMRKGLTLAEIAMALVVIAIVIAAAAAGFTMANTNRKATQLVNEVNQVIAVVQQSNAGKPDFSALDNDQIIPLLPTSMVNGSDIKHAFTGNITVGPIGGDGTTAGDSHFLITIADIPTEACTTLISLELGRGSLKLHGASGTTPLTSTACTAASNDVRLVMR